METDPLFDRLQRALSPENRVERELGRGGMGRVFLATDLTLNCPVAVKVLRPELATAHAAEAFTREAKIMARVRHPNIVTIHRAPPSTEGLHYYIMEFVDGPTLEERLEQSPLPLAEALKMGRDILDALETVHRAGLVHRDVKPSNVFLVSDPRHAKLADFGIAIPHSSQWPRDVRRRESHGGTPAYMAPEQIAGDPLTARTDLYLAAMVIYEAITGRRYKALDDENSWQHVPWRVARVLRHALRENPDARWAHAREFRHALWHTRVVRYLQRAALLTFGGIVVGATAVILIALGPRSPSPGTISVALPAFEYQGSSAQRAVTDSLRDLIRVELRSHPDFRVRASRPLFSRWPFRAPALVIRGRVALTDGDVSVQLSVVPSSGLGTPLSEVRAPLAAWSTLRDSLTYRILLAVWDTRSPLARSLPRGALPQSSAGLARFIKAEQLVAAGEWSNAYLAYSDAETIDPTCWLCSWRLSEAERWLGREHDPARMQRILDHIDAFPPWYQSLIRAAHLPLPQRFDTLRAVTKQWRDFFLGYLQLGDEMFHRGPLEGHARAEAIPVLEQAAHRRPDFAPAWEHLTWVDIIEGDSAGAARALRALDRHKVVDDSFAVAVRALLGVAFAFRFLPEPAAIDTLRRALADPVVGASGNLGAGPRMLVGFDVPRGAIRFGEILAATPFRDLQRSGLIAQTLGSVALGKPARALELAQKLARISPEPEIRRFGHELKAAIQFLDPPGGTRPITLQQLCVSYVNTRNLDSLARLGQAFLRTRVRMCRAERSVEHRDLESARRELLWHEHTDLVGLPTDLPQAAEVDWAFGTLARWRLAQVLLAAGDSTGSCQAYRHVIRLWSDGEPLYRARSDTARQRITDLHCPQ